MLRCLVFTPRQMSAGNNFWECWVGVSKGRWQPHPGGGKPQSGAQAGGGTLGSVGLGIIRERHASPCHSELVLINIGVRCCGGALDENGAELPTVHQGLEQAAAVISEQAAAVSLKLPYKEAIVPLEPAVLAKLTIPLWEMNPFVHLE